MKQKLLTGLVVLLSTCTFSQYSINIKSTEGEPGRLGTLSFVNQDVGFHFSGKKILKTTDAGENWNELISNFDNIDARGADYMTGQFITENIGFVVLSKYDNINYLSDSSFLYKTSDGGINWSLIHTNPPNSIQYCSPSFSKAYFKDENHGWVIGWGLLQGTDDGGQTWYDLYHNPTNEYNDRVIRDICINSDGELFTAGYGGWIQRFSGDGSNLTTQHYYPGQSVTDDYYLNGISFINADTGFVASCNGIVKRTMDGGNTWGDVLTNYIHDNNEVSIAPDNTVWLAAGDYCDNTGCFYSSALLYSTDYGNTWQDLVDQDSFHNRFLDIVWPSPNYGIACSIKGEIHKIYPDNVGVKEEVLSFNIFPNPTSDILTIENDNNLKIDKVEITTLDGKLLQTTSGSTIDISDYSSGVYFLSVWSGSKQYTEKIVKK
mgnify:CR=1 FL=1